ncbi:MAG: lipid-A-disaccharide synthase [Candidatus Sericytochromatia bacterium]
MFKNIFISTGEVSGDIHGAFLAKKLLEINSELNIFAFGSTELKKIGANIIYDLTSYSGVGLIENIQAIKPAIIAYNLAKDFFKKHKIDIVILIDNQGFNIKLAGLAKKMGLKVVYYIGPQEWIWGVGNNWKKIINKIDLLITIFEKEYYFYKNNLEKLGLLDVFNKKIKYFGHPLKNIIEENFNNEYKINQDLSNKKTIGIMAGSRKSEIKSLLPIFIKAVKKINSYDNKINIIFIFNSIWKDFIKENYNLDEFKVYFGESNKYMKECDLIICASGTVTLEATFLNIPCISCYKLSNLSYTIAKMLIKLDYFSLPNIILNKKVIPEFIQKDVNINNIFNESIDILFNKIKLNNILNDYKEIKNKMDENNTVYHIAKAILDL